MVILHVTQTLVMVQCCECVYSKETGHDGGAHRPNSKKSRRRVAPRTPGSKNSKRRISKSKFLRWSTHSLPIRTQTVPRLRKEKKDCYTSAHKIKENSEYKKHICNTHRKSCLLKTLGKSQNTSPRKRARTPSSTPTAEIRAVYCVPAPATTSSTRSTWPTSARIDLIVNKKNTLLLFHLTPSSFLTQPYKISKENQREQIKKDSNPNSLFLIPLHAPPPPTYRSQTLYRKRKTNT